MNRTDEWYDVERVADSGYRIVEGTYYGQCLVEGTERSFVLDAGIGVGDLRGLVSTLVDAPVSLLLTHWHWDHIGNAAQFDDVRIHPEELDAEGRVAIDGRSDEFVGRPAAFVERWRDAGRAFPDGFDPDTYTVDPVENPTTMTAGEEFDLGDRTLETLHTPGHSPGHLAMLDRQKGVLYGGDVVHVGEGLYVHLQGCDLRVYHETFERLIDLRDDGVFDTLVTCHNPPFAGDDLAILDRLEAGIQSILDGRVEGELVETDYGDARRYEFGESVVLTAPDVA